LQEADGLQEKAKMRIDRMTSLAIVGLLIVVGSTTASAQRLGRTYYEDSENGYRFKSPDGWAIIPTQSTEREWGVTCKMEGDEKLLTVSGRTYTSSPELTVLRFVEPEASEVPEEGGGLSGRVSNVRKRRDIADLLPMIFGSYRDLDPGNPAVDKEVKASKKLLGRQRRWTAFTGNVDIVIDTYTFELEEADICLVFQVPEDYAKKWLRVFEKVGRSMQVIERTGDIEYEEGGTYDDFLSYHAKLVERTPGWRVVPTPSKKFVIKTSSDNDKFIDEVIERLELSRALFEQDFPPEKAFDHVSVVRVCGTEEEFHKYGDTGRGVGGWFSPSTTELVLFDYKNVNRNATYAVMSHEAFHQYCHFLFDESEAHRWFDEGHGDYYGGVEFKRGKAIVTKKMPAGFDRLGPIKQMVNSRDYAPLAEHLNYSHQQWQGQTKGFSYAQSWSIIYMLREGALGNVSSKVWKDEYEDILPNYMETLHAGFKEAYAEILKVRETMAKAEGRELTSDERAINRRDLDPAMTRKIWKAAMDASWGQIDLDEFEQNWLTYVGKHL
jgi:hypothetical protein